MARSFSNTYLLVLVCVVSLGLVYREFRSSLRLRANALAESSSNVYQEQREQSNRSLLVLSKQMLSPSASKCRPRRKVAFAKTHKTGSSTLQNVLLRFGVNHNLTFAFPHDSWMFSLKQPMNANLVLKGPWRALGFDLFVSHSVWNYTEVKKIIPSAAFITLLRDPVDCFESSYMFNGMDKNYKADINEYASRYAAKGQKRPNMVYSGKNQLLWDMGMKPEDMEDKAKVKTFIRKLDKQFDLVMFTEHFDESVILMQDLLCWDDKDVQYLNHNERTDAFRSNMTEESRQIYKKWLWADYMLYNFFMSKFQERRVSFGLKRLEKQVQLLRARNENLKSLCVGKKSEKSKLTGSGSGGVKTVYGYEAQEGKAWCEPYMRRETEFAKMIREWQTYRVMTMRMRGVIGQ